MFTNWVLALFLFTSSNLFLNFYDVGVHGNEHGYTAIFELITEYICNTM